MAVSPWLGPICLLGASTTCRTVGLRGPEGIFVSHSATNATTHATKELDSRRPERRVPKATCWALGSQGVSLSETVFIERQGAAVRAEGL